MSLQRITFALVLTACNTLSFGAADRAALESSSLVAACPLGVPWTKASVTESETGALVDFTASSPGHVEELRRRVRDQAGAYGPNQHRGAGHGGTHRGTRDHGLRLRDLGPVTTEVVDTPAGARLFVAPVDPARRAEIRARLVERVAHLESTDCPS